MKQTISLRKLFLNSALVGTFTLAFLSSPVMAGSFVDKDHTAEGILKSAQSTTRSTRLYTGSTHKNMGFIDYDHSAEGRSSRDNKKSVDVRTAGNCGFLDCDHHPTGRKS